MRIKREASHSWSMEADADADAGVDPLDSVLRTGDSYKGW